MSQTRDYYEVLGVDREADQRTIKRAFLRRAREVHPDVNQAADAEERFKEVNEAYSVLSDEQKRARYDRYGSVDGSGMGSGYVDISDIFGGMGMDDIFSSFFGGGAQTRSARRTHGRDMAVSLTVSLEEAAAGTTKTVIYDRLAPCEACEGSGKPEGAEERPCPTCHGSGFVTTAQRSIFGTVQSSAPCPDCDGSGSVIDTPCEECSGQGWVPTHERIEVKIPAGISTGRQLRVQGGGEAGYRGAPAGDLLVTIEVAEHERFQRHHDDLIFDLTISMADAALGHTVTIDGILEGECIEFDIAPGTQVGDTVIRDGYGMPRLGGGGSRGRLIARIFVEIPRKLSADARRLLEEFQVAMGEHDAHKPTVGERIRHAIDDMIE
ncbi:molecular chaperone DnaJ [Collinsella sp. AGMB00827]|uniref:Chaperone protein DnaJ n=1 Tax=Collinsella ureilytica TaxID=2869515 RepID=A0ABS7ML07_9ACTN|nr:molecular chaperone DnaJ [Collinsella urealyticum]